MEWRADRQGDKVTFRLTCPADDKGLYKAYAVGAGGRCLLGTLTPQGDRLTLQRTLGVKTLESQGCWPVGRVERELAFPFAGGSGGVSRSPPRGWRRLERVTLADPVLRECLPRQGPGLFRRDGDGFSLAWPWSPARPFPLTPLFCLGRVVVLEGQRYVVFSFDPQGRPRRPGEEDGG